MAGGSGITKGTGPESGNWPVALTGQLTRDTAIRQGSHPQPKRTAGWRIWWVAILCWLVISPLALGEEICGRTRQVRDTIVAAVGADVCTAVTTDILKDLVSLDLQGQSISTLRLGDFDGLIRLQELKLAANELTTLPSGLFDSLLSLRSLQLHDNQLASLPADLFDRLYLLDELTLHGNELTELPAAMFDDLSRFQGVLLNQDVRGLDRLQQFIQSHEIATAEQFIEALPELHKQRFVFVYGSDGLGSEFVSGTHPRVISWGADARFVFAWTTNPDASGDFRELVEFLIPSGTAWSAGAIDFSGSAPRVEQPATCQSCHGPLNKPLWGTYDGWVGTETTLQGEIDTNSDNMRNLVESTNSRIRPLDFSGSDLSYGHHQRFFRTSDDLTPYMLAVEEIGMVLGLRHAEVLLQRLKLDADYAQFAESTVCSDFPIEHAIDRFRTTSDQTIGVMLNRQQPIQSTFGTSDTQYPDYHFRPGGGTLGEALIFLIVHDLWNDHAEVRQAYRGVSNRDIPVPPRNSIDKQSYLVFPSGTATAEHELIQLHRLHFGHGNRSSLDAIDSVNPTELQFGSYTADFGSGHLGTMLPRVCSALKSKDTLAHHLSAEVGSDGAVRLSWDAPRDDGGITGYRILRGSVGSTLELLVADTGSTTTTYRDPTVTPATAYAYSVVPLRGAAVGGESIRSRIRVPSAAATFTVSAAPQSIKEGQSATLTVAISNGVTFEANQTISLAVSGTASSSDFTVAPAGLTILAGQLSATVELTALDDREEELDETVTLTASHGGTAIGTATVTITSVSHDATLSGLSLAGIEIGTFSSAVSAYVASVGHGIGTTTVTATASHPEAEVSIEPAAEVSLAEGVNEITVTVTAEDGTTTRAYTVTVTRAALPVATVRAGASPVTEGAAATFTVTLDEAAREALSVAVSVTESGSMLSGAPPVAVAFSRGDTSATLSVPTAADSVVEADSAVTAVVAAGTGYAIGSTSSAAVTVEDDDAATFTLTAAPTAVDEGKSATLTVAISNGVTFGEEQTILLAASGTASPSDYTGMPAALTLVAGASSVTATLVATVDQQEEAAETVTATASHGGSTIGTATVTINSVSHDATLAALSLSGVDIGTFSGAVTSYQASVAHSVAATAVTATATHAEASVSIAPGAEVALLEGANEITVTVTAEDGTTTRAYTVTVTRAALPVATVRAGASPVTEGAAATFTVTLDEAAREALSVAVSVTESGSMLSGRRRWRWRSRGVTPARR